MTTSEEINLRKREEYEMQLFGFHSRAARDGIRDIILDEVRSVCKKLCKSIENKYQFGPDELSLFEKESENFIQTYEKNVDARMEKLNNIVKKFISIPSNVLLDEDKGQVIQMSQDEYEELNSKMEDLRKRAKRATMFNAALRQELNLQENFKACKDAIISFAKTIDENTVLPNIENEVIKFTQEAERLNMQLTLLGSSNQTDIYNPTLKNYKEFDSIS